MKKVFINGCGVISAQKTFDNKAFLEEVITYNDRVMPVVNPVYKDFISGGAARRMALGVKMGVVASNLAMQDAQLDSVDAIITGTGMGCLIDSEKFLSKLIDNNEEFLTPTSFIQSTHNTVGGQIALGIQCKGYNFTYVHSGASFESALLDAQLQLSSGEEENILVGGVDENAPHTLEIHKLIRFVKEENTDTSSLLESNTSGAIFGEGAGFFTLSTKEQESSYAQVIAVETLNTLSKENLEERIISFLEENGSNVSEIDAVILGNNGDVDFDRYYNLLSEGVFANTQQVYYKHLCGEYNTASSFGFWLGAKILKTQSIPEVVKLNKKQTSTLKTILLYNQYRGENHSFTLLKQC
ncbi:beta-ketoacyl synthase-like protein [Maribacter vaceletii]|uniref:Beta-ketoacyl synthase-like protein n=1 Tax=Maribacter vaceletii TaxID=1206816 RepID=A0A495EF34_9FLAO|nr:beta-ketoacyl synthase N-terminal-like domain-containing protein [Maribacter vaceletii]RKR14497.1 beta-ketoacyl synthase-like protein [Maribacter vaceletii]